jgi:DNA-binding GntR family transcriptional regulator
VNILGATQAELAYTFAKKSPDKFRDLEVGRSQKGLPLIPGALAHLQCRVSDTASGGTHTVFLGMVDEAAATNGEPLAYYRGRFGRFEDTLQDAAYHRLREFVIGRELAKGERLDVQQLAQQLELDEAHVFYALTKLTGEGLVTRRRDGSLTVRPIDVRTAHEAVDARCAIEVAVVDKVAGAIDEADATRLRAHAEAAHAATRADPPDVQRLLRFAQAFHVEFIGLLANEALLSFFLRLDLTAIWVRASPVLTDRGRPSAAYLIRLLDACIAGDAETAREVLYKHAAGVKAHATQAIESLGGNV